MKKIALISLLFVLAGATINAHAADLRQIDKDLIKAAQEGKTEQVKALLTAGAHVDTYYKEGRTPLIYACYFSQTPPIDLIETLIAHGADINHRDMYGDTALRWAISNEQTDVINNLLAHQADVNASNNNGYTILMNACTHKNLLLVKRLLALGADIYAKNKDGLTAMVISKIQASTEICRYLKDSMPRQSTLHALLAADEFATASDPARDTDIPAFPPELVDRVLQPLIKASLEEDQM